MSQKKVENKELDIFVLNGLCPEANAVFSFKPKALELIKDTCLVVLDTNALIVPFDTGKESLQEIKTVYEHLVQTERLIIPGQVAREFAKIRSEKLKTIYQQISRKCNLSITRQVYPLLESSIEYQKLTEMEKEIDTKLSDYRKQVASLLTKISSWYWDDPVTSLYRELFKRNVISDIEHDKEKLQSDLEYRQLHKIPPGFQDAAKEDKGIGDLIIWHTILELGKTRDQDIIFVTNDSKNDWRYQSENQALYPRFELVEEYRRNSGGKTIHIINFSEFLKLFDVSSKVVDEVRQEEVISSIQERQTLNRASTFAFQAESAVGEWIRANYPDSVIKNNSHGFPNFIVINSKFERLGFEIKVYGESIRSPHFIKGVFYQVQQGLSECTLDKLVLVFVLNEEGTEQLSAYFGNREAGTNKISIVLGTLSSDGKFVQKFYFE